MLNSKKGNYEILHAEQNKCYWRKKRRKKRGERNVTCILIAVIIE
jgi:hypothetical protein